MRLRNIPGADEVIRNYDWVIKEPADKKEKWNTVFGNENPIHIEVGMGKGQFIHQIIWNILHLFIRQSKYLFMKFFQILVQAGPTEHSDGGINTKDQGQSDY